jgi:hypothetical protein
LTAQNAQIWTAILAIGTERAADHNQADIVWTARHKASLLAFGLAVHLRRRVGCPAASNARVRALAIDDHRSRPPS